MAKRYRPGRTLLVFFIGIAVMYGLAALGGEWKPRLGLDLEGGTRITLTTISQGVTREKLEQARTIVDQRVNGSGVAEADVTTSGSNKIVVEIPGANSKDLTDTVKRTAQLRFRIVAGTAPGTPVETTPGDETSPSDGATPSGQATPSDQASPSDQAGKKGQKADQGKKNNKKKNKAGKTATPKPRVAPRLADETPSPASTTQPATPQSTETTPATPEPTASEPTQPAQTAKGASIDDPIAWSQDPGDEWTQKFAEFTCPTDEDKTAPVADDPAQPLITCDEDGNKFLLSKSVIEGTQLKSAGAGIPQNGTTWAVTLSFKSSARKAFADTTKALYANGGQFAIVLDGQVISYAGVNQPILDGNAEITGSFTQEEATSLSNSLKFGALPVRFENPPRIETIGPSLAGNQLQAGMRAGAIGLIVVMLWCLLYYRGLGLVVVASLFVAAAVTYPAVLLLGHAANFTLTLPGIAGLIIGVGVTADSFVIFFERIRDEMREGRSMRVAVETGWKRARKTRVAANTVSLLSAAVLYTFAIGAVKGFGFTLGLSTLIDLAVLFWFTKPMVSTLAKFKFFNGGGELSGLSASTLGMDQLGVNSMAPGTPSVGGGRA